MVKNAFHGETMANIRDGIKLQFIRKNDIKSIIKQQSKLTLNRKHASYANCDSYTFNQNENRKNRPICFGFRVLELSKLLRYET